MALSKDLETSKALETSSPNHGNNKRSVDSFGTDGVELPGVEKQQISESNSSLMSTNPTQPSQPVAGYGNQYEYLTFDTELTELTDLASGFPSINTPNLKQFDDPFQWSPRYKNMCLAISCLSTFLAAYGAGIYGFTGVMLKPRWGLSQAGFETGLTTFGMGFATAPMVLAPFTEINGRRPVFLGSGVIYLVATIGCAVTDSFAGMLVARFFAGVGSSTYSTIIGGVISDVYHANERNKPMAIYAGSAIAGTGFAPLISGLVVDRIDWRWVFYSQAIALGALLAFQILCFKETRGSVLLSRRAKAINKYFDQVDGATKSQNLSPPSKGIRFKVLADEKRAKVSTMLYLSLTTPFKFLVTEPVVFFFSLWAAFAWGVLYMCFNVVPFVYETSHQFNTTQQAAVFTSIVVGAIIGAAVSVYHEDIANKYFPSRASTTPEARLYFTCVEAALLPVGLFWFGWTTYSSVHWIVPTIAITFATIGVYSIYLAVFNYLADVYHRYASSALACQSFCRNTLGAVFPLFTTQMYRALGFPGASSLLGGIGCILTLVPWVLVWRGEAIRARSKIASEIMGQGY